MYRIWLNIKCLISFLDNSLTWSRLTSKTLEVNNVLRKERKIVFGVKFEPIYIGTFTSFVLRTLIVTEPFILSLFCHRLVEYVSCDWGWSSFSNIYSSWWSSVADERSGTRAPLFIQTHLLPAGVKSARAVLLVSKRRPAQLNGGGPLGLHVL